MKIKSLLVLLIIVSCAPTIKNFDNYQKQFASKTKFLPSDENLAGKPAKIVVFNFDENDNQVAVQAGLGSSLANEIENILTKYRLAQLVDRKAAAKLQKEIELSELNKTGSYKGPQVADYAISGSISNAGFTKKYSAGSAYYDNATRTFVTVPPKFTYKSDVSGNIKIYELPSMAVVENIDFAGNSDRIENVQQRGGVLLGGLQIGGEQVAGSDRDDNLVRKAGAEAIDNVDADIKNALAQKGYILEKRVFEDKVIFKINLGSENGLKHGDEFEISGQFETENAINSKIDIERRVIATGRVSNIIDPKTSWVVIDDAKKTGQIRIGDVVKMKYKKSRFKATKKTMMSAEFISGATQVMQSLSAISGRK